MSFTGYQIAHLESLYTCTDFYNFPDIFMSCGQSDRNGVLCPFIPLVNMYISTTDCIFMDLDLYVIWSYFRNRYSFHPESLFRFFLYKCPHFIIIHLHYLRTTHMSVHYGLFIIFVFLYLGYPILPLFSIYFSVMHKHFTCSCFCSGYKHMCLSIASTFIIYTQKQTDKSVCFSQCPTVDFHNFVLFITIFFLSDVPFFSQNRSTRPEVQW